VQVLREDGTCTFKFGSNRLSEGDLGDAIERFGPLDVCFVSSLLMPRGDCSSIGSDILAPFHGPSLLCFIITDAKGRLFVNVCYEGGEGYEEGYAPSREML
jgi:hypothetical protein